MGYTYCIRECGNIECERNLKHAPTLKCVPFGEFNECDKFKHPWERDHNIGEINKDASHVNMEGLNRLKEMMRYVSNTKHN